MSRVLVIGIDSLAPGLLAKWEGDLPHFTGLRQQGTQAKMRSIFPVDSIPAWISLLSGLNPAQHGLIYSFDVFGSSWKDILGIDPDRFKGHTFFVDSG